MGGARRKRPRCPVGQVSIYEADATEIVRGLWQGGLGEFDGCGLVAFHDLDFAVHAAPDLNVDIDEPETRTIAMDDSGDRRRDLGPIKRASAIALQVANRVRGGARVGVFCRQGRNRSGVIVAMAIRHLCRISGEEAMHLVQDMRPGSLDNEHFEEHLRSLRSPRS